MADNQYIEPTISGFNANPPADDGTQVAANQVEWAKHIDKIGNPVKNQTDAMNTNITAAFAKTINTDADQNNSMAGSLAYTSSELTIASGSVAAVRSHHTIDTEADAGTDDLDTITVAGVSDGAVIILRLADAARVVTLKDNTGNIQTKNNEDIVLDANIPTILLRVGTDWFEIQRPVVDNPFNQDLNTTDSPTFVKVNVTGDTSAGDAAAVGGTAVDGLVLAGQGSVNDVTIKNDADVDVITIPTGTNQVDCAGDINATGGTVNPRGDTAAGDGAALGRTDAEGLILTGQGSTNDVTIKNDADIEVMGVPTGTINPIFPGIVRKTGVHPAFASTLATTTRTDETGNGTAYVVVFDSEIFDQGGNTVVGVFTAPVTGIYRMSASIFLGGITAAATTIELRIVTSNRSWRIAFEAPTDVSGNQAISGSALVDMDASDTANVTVIVTGEASDVVDILSNTDALPITFFEGELVA